MANIKYVNNAGKEILLSAYPIRLHQKTSGLYGYKWKVIETLTNSGSVINGFKKEPRLYNMTIDFSGEQSERANVLQDFFEITEHDVISKKAGRLYINEQYVECFVIASEPGTYKERYRTMKKEVGLYIPKQFWIQESKKQFFPQLATTRSVSGLDFPFDFPFDFAAPAMSQAQWNVEHYAPSHFEMTIYGPCVDPIVRINDYPYQIHTALESGDYLTIDSRGHEVIKHLANGTKENIYNSRDFVHSVFEKIPSKLLQIVWSGTFGFDITLFLERSEPKW